MRRKEKRDWLKTGGITAFLAVAVLSFLYANAGWLFGWEEVPPEAGDSAVGSVHFIDCGQGDSTLLLSEGTVTLIDTGPREAGEIIVAYLKKCGVAQIDQLILTHPHEDHIGGAEAVLDSFPVKQIYMGKPTEGTEPTTSVFLQLLEKMEALGNTIHQPKPEESFTAGQFTCTFLGPLEKYNDLNNQSLVLRAACGKIGFLFTGDQEAGAEEALVARYGTALHSTVLKVGHHGSRGSSSSAFLEAVAPAYSVISCGAENPYGHPHQETLEALKAYGIKTIETDLAGTIRFFTDGTGLTIEVEKNDGIQH